jgi:PRTRC genetic system protein B
METINDITDSFTTMYQAQSALVFYQTTGTDNDSYVEYYDMDSDGNPINAHPLTLQEAKRLAKTLHTEKKADMAFLRPKGIVPSHVLHYNPSGNGSVLWYTKAQERYFLFVKSLGLPDGKAQIPTLLWHADRESLSIFALATQAKPKESTLLYYAPFFNIYENGKVCMGTVDVRIKKTASLEEFIQAWEDYFFNSYFSHLIEAHNPIKDNCITLWKTLLKTGEAFPTGILVKNNRTLKDLLL